MKSIRSVFIKTTCMLTLILFSNSFSFTQAQVMAKHTTTSSVAGDISFVKMEGDMLVFDLNLKNLPAKGSRLHIMDEAGNTLFDQVIRSVTHNKRYKIERNNISKIVFEVSSGKSLLNRSFSINTYVEERVEVAKL